MSDRHVKIETKITWSKNADYSDGYTYEPEDPVELDDEAVEFVDGLEVGTSAETVMRTDRYSTMKLFYVKNKDASNYVTVAWTDLTATACTARIPAGQEMSIPGVNPATAPTLQANGAAVLVDIIMVGET